MLKICTYAHDIFIFLFNEKDLFVDFVNQLVIVQKHINIYRY